MPSFSCIPFFACNRQIDVLDRQQCNLQTIPHDIDRSARTLEEIYLDCNHIKELDKPLFRCRKLKILSLSENEIIRLPSDVANLSNLEELNLKGNDVSDVPEEIGVCTQLRILDLSSNPITRLAPTLTQLVSVTHLGLNDVSLTQMPFDIGHMRNLRSLEVRENLLRTIPQSIGNLSQLQRLDLGHNELDDLTSEIGLLFKLEELYVDQNDLEALPETIVHCRSLEMLDASENKLMLLPDEIGDIDQLVDLTVGQNCLQVLPNSIGRLKKLSILKADRNAITQLTPAIGSCISLTELYLTENLLTEIPSSLGNLKNLRTLNLDKNQLKELPSTIGGCTSLSVLSLRDNLIEELPLEIGRLENLRVLDVCNNRLNHLPFTINVLFNLRALWLSENQSQAMLKLQTEQDPRTGIKILSCYLLPQSSTQSMEQAPVSRSFIGGPKVHFGSDLEETREDEQEVGVGQFSRHDTPHPKPHAHAPKFKKQSIDGHIIHHEEDRTGKPPVLTLNSGRKRSDEGSSPRAVSPTGAANSQVSSLRSALKHPPVLPSAASFEQNVEHLIGQRQNLSPGVQVLNVQIRRDANGGLGLSIAGGLESTPYKDDDTGLFVSKLAEGGPAMNAGLKVGDKLLRVNNNDILNVRHQVAVASMQDAKDIVELTILRDSREPKTPYNASSGYATSPNQSVDNSFLSDTNDTSQVTTKETISATIRRDATGSPGFSVAGGKNDAIVISHIAPGGAADKDDKLRVGDRVLSINGTNMRGARHDQAVALLTGHGGSDIYLIVQRDRTQSALAALSSSASLSSTRTHTVGVDRTVSPKVVAFGDSSWDGKTELVELSREDRSLGLSIVGGSDHSSHPFGINAPGVFISKITPNSPAGRCQRLRIGDRILAVNNINIRTAKHQAAVEALKQSDKTVCLLVVHEPQPPGLREVTIKRGAREALGLNICGGIGSPPANPLDKTDEGIFIEKVEPNGPASSTTLSVGTRILEVNDESLLGCTQEEAARILRNSGTNVRLFVCDAFCSNSNMPSSSASVTANDSRLASTASNYESASSVPKLADSHEKSVETPSNSSITTRREPLSNVNCFKSEEWPLAASSPIPPHPTSSMVEPSTSSLPQSSPAFSKGNSTSFSSSLRPLPPPVAPKPKLISNQNGVSTGPSEFTHFVEQTEQPNSAIKSSIQRTSPSPSSTPPPPPPPAPSTSVVYPNPERMAFTSKLEKFEREIETKRPNAGQSVKPALPPAKKPLLNVDEVKRLKEDEGRWAMTGAAAGKLSPNAADELIEHSFEHILNNSAVPSRSLPTVVRTKKAENRLTAAVNSGNAVNSSSALGGEPLNSIEQRALEHQKRQEWRQARYKSLEADSVAAEEVMQQVQRINSRLANITEEASVSSSPLPVNERILQNETSVERNEFVDPVTGATTVSVVEKSITQREIENTGLLLNDSRNDIDFADETELVAKTT